MEPLGKFIEYCRIVALLPVIPLGTYKESLVAQLNKHKKLKLAWNSQLQIYHLLTNNDQMLMLRLSYFKTTVIIFSRDWLYTKKCFEKDFVCALLFFGRSIWHIFIQFIYLLSYIHTHWKMRKEWNTLWV